MTEVNELTRGISTSTHEQVNSANQVMQDSVKANQRAVNITNMTTQQKERSLALQQIVNDMSTVAASNVSGAKISQQSSENLAEMMQNFSNLISQFKIGETTGKRKRTSRGERRSQRPIPAYRGGDGGRQRAAAGGWQRPGEREGAGLSSFAGNGATCAGSRRHSEHRPCPAIRSARKTKFGEPFAWPNVFL